MSNEKLLPSGFRPPPASARLVAADDSAHGDVREANHRIANSLALVSSLVRLQAQTVAKQTEPLAPEQVVILLQDVAARLDGVGRLHRTLSQADSGGALPAGAYLRDVVDALLSSLAHKEHVHFEDHSQDALAPPTQLNAVGLFLTEALTNSLKYAHPAGAPGRIAVAFRRQEDAFELEVADDGVGLPEGFQPETGGGLGFRIMRGLAGQLGGAVAFETRPLGMRTRLNFPRTGA